MFITSSVLDEEVVEEAVSSLGHVFKYKPAYLKGPHGQALKELCVACGISVDHEVYFTALCKWLLPNNQRLNPKLSVCTPGFACLERELAEVKPKVVVTFSKAAFDFMVKTKLKFSDCIGAWFYSEKYNCQVMPMNHLWYVAAKPEWTERYAMDMRQVKIGMEEAAGFVRNRVPLDYRTIATAQQLRDLMQEIRDARLLSIDCEWHGINHVDGKLRSLQICWAEGKAAYIRFMDDKLNYAFDVSYKEAGDIIAPVWNHPDTKLVGHHISADLPFTTAWLGLEWYNKVRLDTEFAYQCCNEHGERGLERMSIRYTDLGRYEIELELWKKDHKDLAEDGYGFVPDSILIPYAAADVDVPFRALPYIERDLEQQGMLPYYQNIMNPFVSNVFTQFALMGLPMSKDMLDEMRELYNRAYDIIDRDFRLHMYEEGWQLLADHVLQEKFLGSIQDKTVKGQLVRQCSPSLQARLRQLYEDRAAEEQTSNLEQELLALCEQQLGRPVTDVIKAAVTHAMTANNFNLRSPPQMQRWLFEVKGYTPIKSTANKAKGVPAMDWSKVMTWKPERREGINPAVDKQTLQILQSEHKDALLDEMMELNAVGNIRKAFLKYPIKDEEGNIIEEAGLFAWIASDGRVHGQTSMTETGRPRSWKPNSLNWPSYLQDKVKSGIARALEQAYKEGTLEPRFHKYVKTGEAKPEPVPPLRACVQAPPGWCLVESDFRTAEIRALAFWAGDTNLIRIMTEPDPQFALTHKGKPVRLKFDANSGIPPEEQSDELLMAEWYENELIRKVTLDDLQKDEAGNLIHPDHDLHWSLVEIVRKKPRERLRVKKDRGGLGKPGNFSCLPSDTRVLTDKGGCISICEVRSEHLLWDGVEWVNHDGLISKGTQPVMQYQGLRATVDHGVWVVDGREMFLGEAALQGLDLAQTNPDNPVQWSQSIGYAADKGRARDILIQELTARGFVLTEEPVYDLVNAGPRHRFTANGVLVSNTAYGATPGTLERKIKADTGIEPEPGDGQKILDALAVRQPVAVQRLKDMEEVPINPGYLRAASGKVRHFVLPPDVHGLSPRLKKSIISAQGREARNFPMQESVAATAQKAANWLLEFARKSGLQGRPITVLYDSVVTMCPLNERMLWSKLHTICMYLGNGWEYHGRILRYPIDTDFNVGWSMEPDKHPQFRAIASRYKDPGWCGTPEHLKDMEKWLDQWIDYLQANERASLSFSGLHF
jgi:uracil-DNA glycosylase family 4